MSRKRGHKGRQAQSKKSNSKNKQSSTQKILSWAAVATVVVGISTCYVQYSANREASKASLAIVSATLSHPITAEQKPPGVIFGVKNVGEGTASNVSARFINMLRPQLPDGPMPEDLSTLITEDTVSNPVSSSHIEPGQENTLMVTFAQAASLGEFNFHEIYAGIWKYYIVGRIEYMTRGERRTLEYCGFAGRTHITALFDCEKWNGSQ